jgi:thioester reductase-like protein
VNAEPTADEQEAIAVIGLGARFPGADGPAAFWRNQRDGVESVRRLEASELVAAGLPAALLDDPEYVPAAGVLPGGDLFDADFFGFSAREAEMLDPQQRLFLEVCWEACEDAGYDPRAHDGAIGVFAGCFTNKYLFNLLTNAAFVNSPLAFFARVFNDKDFLATRVAYMLDLRGPALTVQTACSTSLVATHLACQSLLNFECDMALAGGVALNVPLVTGYPVVDGGLFSPEGRCRPFDARGQGTLPGYGAGVVLLRRWSEARAAGDHVRALIRGSAINNDGLTKVGFTAPSIDAQAKVILSALAFAGVQADSVGYLETHGTGTLVGDPIEIAALTQAFREHTARRAFCALGAVKANIGHLDAAAGVAGLMRAVLALEHGELPPLINFERENPSLELATSPFYVPDQAAPFPALGGVRRAGVSAFGVGGTNAHVVLEQAPVRPARPVRQTVELLPISARSPAATRAACTRLAAHLAAHPQALTDVAYTLQRGRRAFQERACIVATNLDDAVQALSSASIARAASVPPPAVFVFPDCTARPALPTRRLYEAQSVFRDALDACALAIGPLLGADLRNGLRAADSAGPGTSLEPLASVRMAALGYALARQWMAWGVEPRAVIGCGLGEYMAACLAGVFDLKSALASVLHVARLRASTRPPEALLAVPLSEQALAVRCTPELRLVMVTGPAQCVLAGSAAAVARLESELARLGQPGRRLHAAAMEHALPCEAPSTALREHLRAVQCARPTRPLAFASVGTWCDPDALTQPAYWERQVTQPARFSAALRQVCDAAPALLIELGNGRALRAGLGAGPELQPAPMAAVSLAAPEAEQDDLVALLRALGSAWQAGAPVAWQALQLDTSARRVPLPTYPFERRRFWIEPGPELLARPGDPPLATLQAARVSNPVVPVSTGHTVTARVARLWQDLLGLEAVGPHDDFFDVGGDSLLATQVLKQVRQHFGVELSLRELFTASTVSALSALISAQNPEGVAPVASARPPASATLPPRGLDLRAEVQLDADIEPASEWVPDGMPRDVFLTGATGFLGAYLLADLLRHTPARVRCLVRASSPAAGLARMRAQLERYALAHDLPWSRVEAIPGDLALPDLGLDGVLLERLAHELDAVYHCGASVNFARPYGTLRAPNVLGTQSILRLACRARTKPVHHVSTFAVLSGAFRPGIRTLLETMPLPEPVGHDTGYSESKWVAEGLVELARARGVPVAVYRPGMVLGDSRSGISNPDDYLTKMLLGCLQLGHAPLRAYDLAVAPVDWVSRALVALSLQPASRAHAFHLVAPRPLPWNELFAHVRAQGLSLQLLPYEAWRQTLLEALASEQAKDNPLAPLAGLLGPRGDRATPRVDCARVLAGLAGHDLECPSVDAAFVGRVLDDFVRRGWLVAPAAASAAAAPTVGVASA